MPWLSKIPAVEVTERAPVVAAPVPTPFKVTPPFPVKVMAAIALAVEPITPPTKIEPFPAAIVKFLPAALPSTVVEKVTGLLVVVKERLVPSRAGEPKVCAPVVVTGDALKLMAVVELSTLKKVGGVVPPIAPLKVMAPVPELIVNPLAPLMVEEKVIVWLVEVKVVVVPKVTGER